MSHTIPEIAADANALFTALAADMSVDLDLPALIFDTDFPLPAQLGNPAYAEVAPIDIAALTSGTVEGTGVFDVMMRAMGAHLAEEAKKNRITGAEYAKVYLGGLHAVMQYGVQFLLGKDRSYWENLQLQAAVRLAQAQEVRAHADIQIARATIQQMAYQVAETKLKAGVVRNQYALTKMELVTGYNDVLKRENEIKLIVEQVDTTRAQTKDTLGDGTIVKGILGFERAFTEAKMDQMIEQGALTREQVDATRAQTKETLTSGASVAGLLLHEKTLKQNQSKQVAEQYEAARAQIRDTLSTGEAVLGMVGIEKLIKTAQRLLTEEQVDTQRAQTKETLKDGLTPVEGIAKNEKLLKSAQAKLVDEQYESQRGQTRGTLSDGTVVIGLLGAQTLLYQQQVTSYKRDAETKALKMVIDTWTARKTIDEGVAVPAQIDTPAIDAMTLKLRTNLELL